MFIKLIHIDFPAMIPLWCIPVARAVQGRAGDCRRLHHRHQTL